MTTTFTELLRSFVERRNLPVEQVATLANLSRKTLYRWVNGEVTRPRHWSQIVALAKALRLKEEEVDQLLWATKNPGFKELKDLARFEYEIELLEEFKTSEPLKTIVGRPQVGIKTWAALEAPVGAIQPESPFYIERVADMQLGHQLSRSGTTTTIQAGRQTGKTSLLMQAIHAAKKEMGEIVYLDFQILDDSVRSDLTHLLYFLTEIIVEQLNLEWDVIDKYWQTPRNPAHTFNRFLQREVLRPLDRKILLAIDEADLLLDAPYKKYFFSLLRAWDSRRAFDEDWRKLNLVMIISTHPYLLIDDVNLSPFNVGLTIHLKDFTLEQVSDLNDRHGAPLAAMELPELMDLVGGHPYLVRQALYTLVSEDLSLSELLSNADSLEAPFGKHLFFYQHSLNKNLTLLVAMKEIARGKNVDDENLLERLASVGLIKQENGQWMPRCHLYQRFFSH